MVFLALRGSDSTSTEHQSMFRYTHDEILTTQVSFFVTRIVLTSLFSLMSVFGRPLQKRCHDHLWVRKFIVLFILSSLVIFSHNLHLF